MAASRSCPEETPIATLQRHGNCAFVIQPIGPDGVDAPVLVLGRVVLTDTGNREATQDPMTGFACGDTPLGRGHIVALFLGGPDVAQNYAPQYEQWQQGGAWKNMELAVRQLALKGAQDDSLYMLVELSYGRQGNSYLTEKAQFQSGVIHNWTDARIPSRYRVWTFRASAADAATRVATVMTGAPGPALQALLALPQQAFLQPQADFDVTQVPDEDYAYWARNLIRSWARLCSQQALQAYQAEHARQAAAAPATARPSRRQASALEAQLQAQHGFGKTLSTDAWMLDNIHQVVAFIRARLATNACGLRDADITRLNSAGAAQLVVQMLT